MRGVFATLIAALLASAALSMGEPRAQALLAETELGRISGMKLDGGAAFYGIPYAAAPMGALRWRPPQPGKAWSGVRDATRFGPICSQPSRDADGSVEQSEDCLTLNVVAPARHSQKLPVLVSIHGGAFAFGSGRYLADRGISALVRRGVVLVSPNYRVGRLGFFAHPAIASRGHGDDIGNYWLMDQIAALSWVRHNIANFGGDPDNVTILGCSAGGTSVDALIASPPARGLFARASAHSGGGLFNTSRTLAVAEAEGLAFAARAGVTGSDSDALVKLRALTPEQIMAADPGAPSFGAIVDGRLLTEDLSLSFATGGIAPVPMLSGSKPWFEKWEAHTTHLVPR